MVGVRIPGVEGRVRVLHVGREARGDELPVVAQAGGTKRKPRAAAAPKPCSHLLHLLHLLLVLQKERLLLLLLLLLILVKRPVLLLLLLLLRGTGTRGKTDQVVRHVGSGRGLRVRAVRSGR